MGGDALLICKGYRILGHRLRTPYGEVDVAAWKDGVLVIVEVKARDYVRRWRVCGDADGATAHCARRANARGTLAADAAPIRFDLVVIGSGLLPRHERGAWFDERASADLKRAETIAAHTRAPCVHFAILAVSSPPRASAAA